MARLEISFERRKPIEGGICFDKTDDGCWNSGKAGVGELTGTNWGVTSPEYSEYLGRKVTKQDMIDMPEEHALAIFKKTVWDKIRGNEIKDQGVANDIYDTCVNQGLVTGIRQAQESLGIAITGKMDDNTLKHLNNEV